jgi:hypothetical protein
VALFLQQFFSFSKRNFEFRVLRVLNFIHSVGYTVFKNKFEVTVFYHLKICEILVGYEVL